MEKYWCDFITYEGNKQTIGYRTLQGLLGDIQWDIDNATDALGASSIVKFYIRVNGEEGFYINNPKYDYLESDVN